MAYTITLSNGSTLPVVLEGVTDTTSTSITLIGKNYVGYGAFLNQNFVKLLENFSNVTAPAHPLSGQLWWSTDQKTLSVFTGAGWKALASSTVGPATPAAPVIGDQWFDTTVGQLKAWNSSSWVTIGPGFTTGQGISGAIAETVIDSLGASHVVVKFYISGTVSAILSKDATFTPATAILGFNAGIKPGFNLAAVGNFLYYNDAYNALNLGGTAAANYARTDIATTFNSTVNVSNNAGLTVGSSVGGDFSAAVTSSAVNLKSVTVGKSLNLIAAGQSSPALSVASGTGLVTVAADPVAALGVATKQYVDSATAVAISGSATVLKRDGTNTVTGIITPDVTATRDLGTTSLRFAKVYATSVNVAGLIETTTGGIKYPDGTIQTTAATSAAVGSVTPDRLSAGGPYWLGNGHLGVGTTTPTFRLDVSDTARIANGLVLASGSGSAFIYAEGNTNNFIVRTGPSSAYRYTSIDAAGNLGVQGGITAGTITGAYSGSQAFVDQDTTKGAFYTEIAQAGSSYVPALKIRTGGAARIRFASFGALHNTDGTVDTVIHAIDSTDANNNIWRFTNAAALALPGPLVFSDGTSQTTASSMTIAESEEIWRFLSTPAAGGNYGYYIFNSNAGNIGNSSRGTYYNNLLTSSSSTECSTYESGEGGGGTSCGTVTTYASIGPVLITVVNKARRTTMRINLYFALRLYTDDTAYFRLYRDGNIVYNPGSIGNGQGRLVSGTLNFDIPPNSQSTFTIDGTIAGGSNSDSLQLETLRTSLNAWI